MVNGNLIKGVGPPINLRSGKVSANDKDGHRNKDREGDILSGLPKIVAVQDIRNYFGVNRIIFARYYITAELKTIIGFKDRQRHLDSKQFRLVIEHLELTREDVLGIFGRSD